VAFLDEQTGHAYTEIMQMPYADFLILNLDTQAHLRAKQKAIEQTRQSY